MEPAAGSACRRCGKPAAHMHHRKRRPHCTAEEYASSANVVPVCVECHTWIHANVHEAYVSGWLVASYADPNVIVPVAIAAVRSDHDHEHDHTGLCEICGDRITKRRTKMFRGEERRKRKVIAVRVPDDWEDGGAVWDETLDDVKRELVLDGLYDDAERIPNYEAIIAGLRDYVDTRPLVRSYREK